MIISAEDAVKLLLQGEAVAVPTETVYGLAAIATNPEAVAKIFEIKNRPADNPLICHFHSIEEVYSFVAAIPVNTLLLMHRFSPGPLSFMLDLPDDSPLLFATAGNRQVIARIPGHPVFLSIIAQINVPLAAPSANTSGTISPTAAAMVAADLGAKIAGIVDGGDSAVGLESTIVDARSHNEVIILRPGIIGEAEIRSVLPDVTISTQTDKTPAAIPGTKYRHYAPATPVFRLQNLDEINNHPGSAVFLVLEDMQRIARSIFPVLTAKNIHLLSLGSLADLRSMARNFYQVISSVDQLHLAKAYFLIPDFGDSSLGKALQNRLDKILD
ncbi:MAG: threonylcarbamoyl-AMP synthase [Chitinophagales bacterium]|nr:threonylcarbamoyl-AMP synthase [Chitinophagales bacterium]